jgi:hypothetical protein
MAVAQRLQLFASLLYGVHKPATEWLYFTHKLDALEMMGASDVPECCRSLLPHQVDPPRRGKPRGQLEHGPRYGESGPNAQEGLCDAGVSKGPLLGSCNS